MPDVTHILAQIESGNPAAAEQLLPLVYEELRKLAAAKLAPEKSGQTLQATALVHDAFVRLVDLQHRLKWNSRGHFFAAAGEAMRRILVETIIREESIAGAVIGSRYTMVQRIGEGGMGDVRVATQTEPVKRKVATGVMKRRMR